MCVCTCVRLVPDVGVEGFSECVEAADDEGHEAEEGDSGRGADALQQGVDPHPRHLVHPAGPGWAEAQAQVRTAGFHMHAAEQTGVVPEDVGEGEAAERRQAAGPARVAVPAGPHLDDDEGQNRGVLGAEPGGGAREHTRKEAVKPPTAH